jgi:hypothetical protein
MSSTSSAPATLVNVPSILPPMASHAAKTSGKGLNSAALPSAPSAAPDMLHSMGMSKAPWVESSSSGKSTLASSSSSGHSASHSQDSVVDNPRSLSGPNMMGIAEMSQRMLSASSNELNNSN